MPALFVFCTMPCSGPVRAICAGIRFWGARMPANITIAIPSTGDVRSETFASVLSLTHRLRDLKVGFSLEQYQSADIARSRNVLAARFMAMERMTHLLFIDSDMSFAPAAIERLIAFDQPVTAAICPKRQMDVDRLRTLIEADAHRPATDRTDTETLMAQSQEYAFRTTGWDGAPWPRTLRDGFLSVPGIGMAVTLIARPVLQTMLSKGAAMALGPERLRQSGPQQALFSFFNPLPDGVPGATLGEDLSFCKRWVHQCGGLIWADTTSQIAHHGSWAYRGRFGDFADVAP